MSAPDFHTLTGYSIWLLPEAEAATAINHTMQTLQALLGGPSFVPHLTVLGQLRESQEEILLRFQILANAREPLTIAPADISVNPDYYRSITYPLSITPELDNLNREARRLFQRTSDPPYEPHVSLSYGKHSAPVKLKVLKTLACTPLRSSRFDRLTLVQTIGLAEAWLPIRTVQLLYASNP